MFIATNAASENASSESVSSAISFPQYTENTREVTTDILFLYTESAIEKVGGIDELYAYIDTSVNEANDYMILNKVSITRRVAAVIPFDGEVNESTDGLGFIETYVRQNKATLEAKYGASYYVLIVGDMPDNKAGAATVNGGSIVMTYFDGGGAENDTLAHELGHNDGLVHTATGAENFNTTGGFACGKEASLMSIDGANRTSNFLSSPEVMNTETGDACGVLGTADVRQYYFNAVENNRFVPNDFSFRNYVPPKEKTGVVSYVVANDTYDETIGSISVIVNWSGVTDLDSSVELYARSITAGRVDFNFDNDRIIIDAASGSVVVDVVINDDELVEDVEKFELGLRHNVGVTLVDSPMEISLVSDDILPKGDIQVSGTLSITEGSSSSLVVTRLGGSSGELVGSLVVTNGTASDNDYTIQSVEFTFLDGENTKEILINAVDDTIDESNESLSIGVATNEQNSSASGSVAVTIVDNDTTPVAPRPEAPSSNGGGGGSVGISALLLAFVAIFRRKKIN